MNKTSVVIIIVSIALFAILSFKRVENELYLENYTTSIGSFSSREDELVKVILRENISTEEGINSVKKQIQKTRISLKKIDFWLRYLEPNAYHKINGPLPVEWETEVFEKYEKPYKREGAGLTLAELYLDEKEVVKDSLLSLIKQSKEATNIFLADSITENLESDHSFYLANRLFILNLSTIYTTGFECPDTTNIVPELIAMLESVQDIYKSHDQCFLKTKINDDYLNIYGKAISFVKTQPSNVSQFDHFTFIKDYVNPLFTLNQHMIADYGIVSKSFIDYSLNNDAKSIFSKSLYRAQNIKGIYIGISDPAILREIRAVGKLLFYDPILSGNGRRSCASCHKPTEYFTDTSRATAFQFDGKKTLPRNTPTLINAEHNHLLMLDGKHISLINQIKDVVTNQTEMGGKEVDLIKAVLSCADYRKAFRRFVQFTPNAKKISVDHILSAVILYYTSFSNFTSPFDEAMNQKTILHKDAKNGFNLFMGKAQCATCHFAPYFNGVKPPYVNSEFEVIGTPEDTSYKKLSPDMGRGNINPASETQHAMRTSGLRNVSFTGPFMHNGVFNTLQEVLDFYNAGGGAGRNLKVENQTLSADSLKLTKPEMEDISTFIKSLNENIIFESPPAALPVSDNRSIAKRKVGGEY